MQYMLLIWDDADEWQSKTTAEKQEVYARHDDLIERLRAAGAYVAGHELASATTATCVRVRTSKTIVTDGPYAESKEQLGGYYLVKARDIDEAIEIAARIPTSARGAVEVRPLAQH